MNTVHFVLPADVDDPAAPSGGNVYDRRLAEGLRAAGWTVHELHEVNRLAALPVGSVVLLDGLLACNAPEIVVPQAERLRLAVLVHLPLAEETGLSAAAAAELDAREREVLHAVAAVVATGPAASGRLAVRHGLSLVHVVPPGVDPQPRAPGTDGVSSLLCVASVTPRKAQDVLVEALARVAELPWHCRLAGPLTRAPEYVGRVRELIARHGLAERIDVLGPRTGLALDALYAQADLVILPSHAETYGMVVTEALARGIPVLATEPVAETVGVYGIVVPPGDVGALAGALRHWFEDPVSREWLRAQAPELPGWGRTVHDMADVLTGIAG
ncbi:glycosyltransferase family 4 protein [Amycolatopsis sp.]|uniref:glycosyltransferase family 4 protein n=1 Tax=Amycolatopsis sp. TaxID=37632 RepID=UPI002B7B11ED|nr:glycosyltransferase family 4 protein [Amycolatopsis sp.]HVV07781.1 glycosyltransferase family 4 protein [Amycolatopsis sp.]